MVHWNISHPQLIMAILTAILVSPSNGSITIYTDSQNSIKTYHSSANLSAISPRRYNKINNHILWSVIHFIVKSLSLTVEFIKDKAHSNDTFNDIADAQAKIGRSVTIPTSILYRNLPSQTSAII